jgi:multiple sugar transport system ATP-binding protein
LSALTLANVSKAYGATPVLEDISLEIADGEFVVFVGPSGCGKSTLLRLIAGLDDVSSGEILINGLRVNEIAPAKRGVAMVFQSYALYPHMSAYDNMAFALKLAGTPKQEIGEAVNAAARKLHIEQLLDRKPRALSGGQRQRVAIGRAIVRKPKIFLFDEPLSNLDAALRTSMRYEFARLHDELKTTMIYVTHDQIEAMTLAKRIVVLSQGRIEQVGTPMELYRDPRNVFVAGFIGSPRMNFLAGKVEEASARQARVRLATGTQVTAAVDAQGARRGDEVTLGIRPESFDPATAENALTLHVRFVEALGGVTMVYGTLAGTGTGTETEITVQLPGEAHLRAGDTTPIGAAASACHLFDASGVAFRRHHARSEAVGDPRALSSA